MDDDYGPGEGGNDPGYDYDIGTGYYNPGYDYDVGPGSGAEDTDLSGGRSSAEKAALYGKEGYGEGMTGQQTAIYDRALSMFGDKGIADSITRALTSGPGGGIGGLLSKGIDFATSKGGMAALMALLAAMTRKKGTPAYGGGVAQAYVSPTSAPQQRIIQGPYGPIAQYYAGGGPVAMEDGGFVMTKRAVDGAGGPDGIRQLIPGARPIHGPGTGTSDSIPAYIKGKDGRTPAKVSNGEAYVPKDTVDRLGGAARMYAMMHKLQRRG